MSAIFLMIKNVFHGLVAALMLTMGRTINSEEEVVTLTQNGADCIMTDYPQMAYEAVQSCQ